MKKILTLVALVLPILGGCAKSTISISDNESIVKRFSFYASAEEMSTKGTYDASGSFTWKSGDQIGMILNSDNAEYGAWVAKFSFNSSNNKFELDEQYKNAPLQLGDDVYYGGVAFHPYGLDNAGTNSETNYSISNSTLYVHLFGTREYSADFTPIPLAANLRDERNPASMTLKHVAAGVRIQFSSIPEGVTKACLTVKDQDITGWYSITKDNIGNSSITAEGESADRGNTATYTFSSTPSGPVTLTYAVPPLNQPIITISLYKGDQIVYSKTSPRQSMNLAKGQILVMPQLTPTNDSKVISVGVISYLINDLGETGYEIHYWGGATGALDAPLSSTGISEQKSVGYWEGNPQTFKIFTGSVPNDITGFKVHHGDRWFGDDANSGQTKAYIFNYSGDKALYE